MAWLPRSETYRRRLRLSTRGIAIAIALTLAALAFLVAAILSATAA